MVLPSGSELMRTHYKHIYFEDHSMEKPITRTFMCREVDGDDELGVVKWHYGWRQYCFFPTSSRRFPAVYLANIADVIAQLEEERKEARNR